jgi:hypothetical protein
MYTKLRIPETIGKFPVTVRKAQTAILRCSVKQRTQFRPPTVSYSNVTPHQYLQHTLTNTWICELQTTTTPPHTAPLQYHKRSHFVTAATAFSEQTQICAADKHSDALQARANSLMRSGGTSWVGRCLLLRSITSQGQTTKTQWDSFAQTNFVIIGVGDQQVQYLRWGKAMRGTTR